MRLRSSTSIAPLLFCMAALGCSEEPGGTLPGTDAGPRSDAEVADATPPLDAAIDAGEPADSGSIFHDDAEVGDGDVADGGAGTDAGSANDASEGVDSALPDVGVLFDGSFPDTGWTFDGSIPDIGWTFDGSFPDTGWTFDGSIPDIGWTFDGSIPDIGWTFDGSIPDIGWTFDGSIPDIGWSYDGGMCSTSQPCPQGYFCETFPNACNASGTCYPLPPQGTGCPTVYIPVCGCDGNTYGNDCERWVAGVAKDHNGPC